jgi:hypothetical protein
MPPRQRTPHNIAPLPPPSPISTDIAIDREALVRLRAEAQKRDMPVTRLARDLLEAIAEDRLVDAVLPRD